MTYKLFLDDERFPAGNDDWFIARTVNDAVQQIITMGIPSYISFDHDLGDGATGYDFTRWLLEFMMDNSQKFPANFGYYVHSMNPIGAANIRNKMDNALKHIGYDNEL